MSAETAELLPGRELGGVVDTVLRLAKSTGAEETEVHVDEVADALTRFANNAIHQNVAEHGLMQQIVGFPIHRGVLALGERGAPDDR